MDSWGTLFDRAAAVETDIATIRERLARLRDRPDRGNDRTAGDDGRD